MFRIVYEIAIAVGLLYLIIWLVMTLVGQARRQGVHRGQDPGTSALLTQDDRGHDHPGGGDGGSGH